MADRTDVAVIGAGVIGLSCARELAGAGVSVTVLEEAAAAGRGSSALANGGIRAQFTTEVNVAFSRFSIDELETLERTVGGLGFHQTGYLMLAGTDASERGLRDAGEVQRRLGVETRWLDPAEIDSMVPFIRADGIRGGTFHARDGFLDPAGLVAALLADARTKGATIITRAAVSAIEPGFVVRHAEGDVRAEAVVNAAGTGARSVARLLGSAVPVEPVRRNLAHVMDPSGTGGLTPMTVDVDTGVLVRREPAGGWVVAYADPDDPPGWDTSVDPAFLPALAARLPNRFPSILDLPIDPSHCWAGLYPETPDHHAIIGEDPAVPGLFHCVGFGGHGLMHAPAAGRAIAELVARGRSETFDLRPLRPSRFVEGDLVVESAVL
ncbi:MAG: FAD-binding oxidoreductase [Actinomycetota bacterium]|nr:FAD-binding oxidoreductase [Actinomycetota bacterium]